MTRLLALGLALALTGPAAAEDYPTHVPCRGVVLRGPFRVLSCAVEVEARSTLVVYFRFDRPVTSIPGLMLHSVDGYRPAPAGVTITLVRLYPDGEPASEGKANAVKVAISNDTDVDVDLVASAWVGR